MVFSPVYHPSMPTAWSTVLPRGAFLHSLRQSSYTYSVNQALLTSSTFKIINPRHHVVATDNVSQNLPARSLEGLDDEKILALFTSGFFGGFVFSLERWALWMGAWRFLPARFTGGHCPDVLLMLSELMNARLSGQSRGG